MSDRRSRSKAKTKSIAWIAAGLVHLVIIGAMVVNFTSEPKVIQSFDADVLADTVKATVVDESEIKNRQDQLKKNDQDKKRKKQQEEQRLKDLQRKAQEERERISQLQDQTKLEEAAAEQAERKRKEVKLQAEKEELERLKKEEERKKREEAQRKKRVKQAADKKKLEEAERLKLQQQEREAQTRLNQLLEEESQMLQEQERVRQQQANQQAAQQQALRRTTTLMSRYGSLIEAAVHEKLRAAPGTEPWRKAKVNIKVSPLGDVESVRIIESSGSVNFDRSAETAVLQASPLPFPTKEEDITAHTELQNLNITIKP